MEHNLPFYRSEYRYKSGNKEVWACKAYTERGKEACSSPIIYTTELNEIIKQACNTLIENKVEIIHDMIKIYSEIMNNTQVQIDIAKLQTDIDEIMKKKDKLLDLSIKGKITDNEFEVRNESFNAQISNNKAKIEELKLDELKNKLLNQSIDTLRNLITKELDFENNISVNLVDSLIDRIEVYKTDDKHIVNLKVFFKIIDEKINYCIKRNGRNTSVCSEQYTLNVSNRSFTFLVGPAQFGREFQKLYNVGFYIEPPIQTQ